MSTVEVRIRTSEDTKAVRLCDWDISDLDALLPLLGGWGIQTDYGTYDTDSLSGQFTFNERGAFFEVIAEIESGS